MARNHGDPIQNAEGRAPRVGPRTYREKLLSAAKAIGLDVTDSWDDKQLEREIKAKAAGTVPDRKVSEQGT